MLATTSEFPDLEVDTGISKKAVALTEDCPDIEELPSFSTVALEETILSTDFITDAAYITLAPALTLELEDIDEKLYQLLKE